MTRWLDRLIEGGLLTLFLFAPLPFGSVFPWAQAAIEGTVAVLVGLWLARLVVSGEVTIPRSPLLGPALVMAGLVALQIRRPGGTVSPAATTESARLALAYLGLLLVLGHHLVTRARIVRVLAVLVGWGVALALLGRVNQARRQAGFGWWIKDRQDDLARLTSTFINPNHQAFYFTVLLFLALGLLLGLRRFRRPSGSETGGFGWPAPVPLVCLVGAVLVLGGALLLTLSRGGLLAAAAGLLVVGACLRRDRGPQLSRAWLGGLLLAGLIGYASIVGLGPILGRGLGTLAEPIGDFRWPLGGATLRTVAEAPWLGLGLGAFQDAFAPHRPLVIPQRFVIDYAHNDYLQLLAETGVAGLAVLAWALWALGRFVLRRWSERRDPFVRGVTIGGLGALAAVLVHSALDFSLHLPANALLVVLLGALLPAVVALRADGRHEWVDLPTWRWPVPPWLRPVGIGVAVGVVAVAGLVVVPAARADWQLEAVQPIVRGLGRAPEAVPVNELVRAERELTRAARLDPGNPAVQAALARVSAELGVRGWNGAGAPVGAPLPPRSVGERLAASQTFFATAYESYQESLRGRPRAAELHERLGWLLGTLETLRLTVRGTTLTGALDPRLAPVVASDRSAIPDALAHVQAAARWDPGNAYRHRNLARFALAYVRESVDSRRLVADEFRQALLIEPALLPEVVDQLASRLVDDALIQASVPRQYPLLLALAQQLPRYGRASAALATLEAATPLARGPAEQVALRLATARVLVESGEPARALAQAQAALTLAPTSPAVYAAVAEAYEARQQWGEALEALGTAVRLAEAGEPQGATAYRARLAALLGQRGEREQALLVWRHIVQASPGDAWAHVELARLLEQQGESTEAFQEYRVAERLGARDVAVRRAIAEAYLRQGLLHEAIGAYEAALRIEPANDRMRMALAQLYTRIGSRDQALAQQGAIVTRSPARAAPSSQAVSAEPPPGGDASR